MSKYEHIEELIKYTSEALIVEDDRNGGGLLMGIEQLAHHKTPIRELIDRAISPGDMDAMDAHDLLYGFSRKHPAFMFVEATCLEEGLIELEEKAILWSKLNDSEKEEILHELYQCTYVMKNSWEIRKLFY